MEEKKYFNSISRIHLEACLTLPIEELEAFDNAVSLKHIKFQFFQSKKELFKERNSILIDELKQRIKDKVSQLADMPTDALQEMLLQRSPNMQFRNLDKLEKDEIIRILEDYMLLENWEDEIE